MSFELDPKLSKQERIEHDERAIRFVTLDISKEWHVTIPTSSEVFRAQINRDLVIKGDRLDDELMLAAHKIGSYAGPAVELKAKWMEAKDELVVVTSRLRDQFINNPKTPGKGAKTVKVLDGWVSCDPSYQSALRKVRKLESMKNSLEEALWAFKKKADLIIEYSQRTRRSRSMESTRSSAEIESEIEVDDDEPTPEDGDDE